MLGSELGSCELAGATRAAATCGRLGELVLDDADAIDEIGVLGLDVVERLAAEHRTHGSSLRVLGHLLLRHGYILPRMSGTSGSSCSSASLRKNRLIRLLITLPELASGTSPASSAASVSCKIQ